MSPEISERSFEEAIECGLLQYGPDACVGDATAVREAHEELGLVLDAAELEFVGAYLTDAANEPGHWLRSDVYRHRRPVTGERAASEIAEARWVDPHAPEGTLAPLFIALLPLLRA